MNRWPHAPSHLVCHPGAYIVTAGTHHKELLFNSMRKLDLLEGKLLEVSEELGWSIQAWAVFPNHYHLVGHSPDRDSAVRELTSKLHAVTARELNKLDRAVGRKVWFNHWDTRLTFEKSYLARLRYVHENAVKHGIVRQARDYRWCSAQWFYLRADKPFFETVASFPLDRVRVQDEFDLEGFGAPGRAEEGGARSPHSQIRSTSDQVDQEVLHSREIGAPGRAEESGARSPHSQNRRQFGG